jgi:hypothetical protein
MTITISNAYVQTFENNVRHLAQQGNTRLRQFVAEVHTNGQYHNFERLGTGTAVQKTTARAATPTSDLAWSRRRSTPTTWHTGETSEPEDAVQMLVDPNSNIAKSLGVAMKRAVDDIIIAAATGNASDGAGTPVTFPAGQKVGDGTGVITLDLVLEVSQKFEDNDIDPDEAKVFIIGTNQKRRLMQLMEVTSGDYQNSKALATGVLPNWNGFTWIVSNRLLAPSAGEISCLAFTKRALGLQINKDIWTRIAEDPTHSFNWIMYAAMTMGAVRVEDEHIVHVHLLDAITVP